MDNIWTTLGIPPTKDVSAIRRAYAEKTKTCHPEEDPKAFMNLRQAYQAAIDYAEGKPDQDLPRPEDNPETSEEEDPGWTLQEDAGGPNPFEGGEAITKFLELYTGKQRKNPVMWMNYVTSDAFLDAAWDPRFTSLLLQKVRERLPELTPGRECLAWLNAAYQFSGAEDRGGFEGLEDIRSIAALGPAVRPPKGNEFAVLQSFLDYRHLNGLADAGRWDQEALEAYRQILGRYVSAYIRERCEQRVTPDCERHPAGLRVFLHFFRRTDLPEVLFREAWQRLDLKSAVMGRAKVLYGPLRALALERAPGIGGETAPVNFLRLTRNLDAYLKRIKADPDSEPQESQAFFDSPELQEALPVPRFLAQQLLSYSPWRREGMGEGLIRRMLEYYQEHIDIPRAEEVISGLAGDLRLREAKRQSLEDAAADPEGIPYYEWVRLCYRPFLRWWLNTAFYTARDPESGTLLLEYLEKYLPYQEGWSRRFTQRADGTPRTIAAAMGMVEIDCYPMHLEYRVNGRPVYRPCLTWEQTARESGDWFALLLPITAAPCGDFEKVAEEIFRRLDYLPVPEEDRILIARCLAGHVCRLPRDPETGETASPEEALPMELSMEGSGRLYTAVWREAGPVEIYRQTASGRRKQEELIPDPEGTWAAAPGTGRDLREQGEGGAPVRFAAESGLEAAKKRLAELTDPRFFDLSRLRELPRHIWYTAAGGEEETLTRPDLLRPQTKPDAWALLEQWGLAEIPPDLEQALARVQRAMEEAAAGEEERDTLPPEPPVTREAIADLLYRFSQGEMDRVEMEWPQGRLVLCRHEDRYAGLYFESSFGHGERWYALLADPETYRTVAGEDIAYVPFGMGKLAEYSVFPSAQALLRDIDQVLGQMGWGQIQDGGPGGWLWSCTVNLQDAGHRALMAQQKLGGVPPTRGRGYYLSKPVLSRFPSELETWDLRGERRVTALGSGTYGLASGGVLQLLTGKLARVRLSWTFPAPGGGTELRHLVLLQDQGKYMLFWLEDGSRRARAYAAEEPRRFLGRALPAGLVHGDPRRLRNGIDLLLEDIDNTEPVLSQPGQFVELHGDYEGLRAELVRES